MKNIGINFFVCVKNIGANLSMGELMLVEKLQNIILCTTSGDDK